MVNKRKIGLINLCAFKMTKMKDESMFDIFVVFTSKNHHNDETRKFIGSPIFNLFMVHWLHQFNNVIIEHRIINIERYNELL